MRMYFRNILLLVISITVFQGIIFCQEVVYKLKTNIPYYDEKTIESDSYVKERCVLDVYYPENKKDFATIIWFHGGGLSAGNKEIPEGLKKKGLCVVGVNYRLYPKVKSPAYIMDAAAAISWVFRNIGTLGGDTAKIFISGHSAGAYLCLMVGLDKKWLAGFGTDANKIAGIISLSGQTITHFAIRKERGIPDIQPVVDEMAPLYHVRADAAPILLLTGDRELEMLGRYEENAYLMRMLKISGHKQVRLFEFDGYGHDMVWPAIPLLLSEVERICKLRKTLAP
ncbi:MAG: alpha/beta hydrolase [Bacteroidales bacterium]